MKTKSHNINVNAPITVAINHSALGRQRVSLGSQRVALGRQQISLGRNRNLGTLATVLQHCRRGFILFGAALCLQTLLSSGATAQTVGHFSDFNITASGGGNGASRQFNDASVRTIVPLSDGSFLLGGSFTSITHSGGTTPINYMAHVNADGSLDTSFDLGISEDNRITGRLDGVHSIVVQDDDKILFGGMFTTFGSGSEAVVTRNNIARLNTDLMLDTSFNPNVTHSSGLGRIFSIALEGDNILLGGNFTSVGSGSEAMARNHIARINSIDGVVDASFNPNADGRVRTIQLQGDDKILLGGIFTKFGSDGTEVTRNNIARINSIDGTVDSFTISNLGASGVFGSAVRVNVITLQTDGKILVGGDFARDAILLESIMRLDKDGVYDTDFKPVIKYHGSDDDVGNYNIDAITLQSDGKILLGGAFTDYGTSTADVSKDRPGIIRITPAANNPTRGAEELAVFLDGDFEITGGTDGDVYTSIVPQGDNTLLLGGSFTLPDGRINLARITLPDSTPTIKVYNMGRTVEWIRGSSSFLLQNAVTLEIAPAADEDNFSALITGEAIPDTDSDANTTSGNWTFTIPDEINIAGGDKLRLRSRVLSGSNNSSSFILQAIETNADQDDDGTDDTIDNCLTTANPDQSDSDGYNDGNSDGNSDGLGDACEDKDSDGVVGDGLSETGTDLCPDTPMGSTVNPDGCTDNDRLDGDMDGVINGRDKCLATSPGATVFTSGVNRGCADNHTEDDDNDGVPNGQDQCPITPADETANTDGGEEHGCSANDLLDGDMDGVSNGKDRCLKTREGEMVNTDGGAINGCSANDMGDGDGDGVINGQDNCPNTMTGATLKPNPSLKERGCTVDELGDDDEDTVNNGNDRCPGTIEATPRGRNVDANGCTEEQYDNLPDGDGDGVADFEDLCPNTPEGEMVHADGGDINGCSVGDDDNDGVVNDQDNCPKTPMGATLKPNPSPEERGCTVDELNDDDIDRVINGIDNCRETKNTEQENSDGDTFGDACDNCPEKTNQDQADNNNDRIGNLCESGFCFPVVGDKGTAVVCI